MDTPTRHTEPGKDGPELKIYFLPNLMTAGNLFFGFVALTQIVGAEAGPAGNGNIKIALGFILLACICDLLDGRLARMGGVESPFGREFDSLADLISFGAAPAFLVHRVVMRDVFVNHEQIGWFIASIYLICGAFRLARFNCLASMSGTGGGKEFLGFPIPSAAGLVASLPPLMLFLSWMMVSNVKYPTFKTLDLKATRTFTKTLAGILLVGAILVLQQNILIFVLPVFFTAYLVYGFIRPRISHQMRREIEEEDEDDSP